MPTDASIFWALAEGAALLEDGTLEADTVMSFGVGTASGDLASPTAAQGTTESLDLNTNAAGVAAVDGVEDAQGWNVDGWTPTANTVGGKDYLTGVVAKGSRLHALGGDMMDIVDGGSYLVCAEGWIQKGTKMSRSVQGCTTISIPEPEIPEGGDDDEDGEGSPEVIQESSEDGILSGLEDVDGAGAGRDEMGNVLPVPVIAESHASALAFSFAAVALSAIVM
jgi:hypothetical protein